MRLGTGNNWDLQQSKTCKKNKNNTSATSQVQYSSTLVSVMIFAILSNKKNVP